MKISDIVTALDQIAPPQLAEDWDNVGLLIGDAQSPAKKLLLCIDLTAEVLAEAKAVGASMVMAYHPVIFKPMARLTRAAAPIVYDAARAGLAVYSTHTALDIAPEGTNDVLADVLGLRDRRPLSSPVHKDRCKIVVFVKPEDMSGVADAAFEAGAGRIGNYERCAFFVHGVGTFYSGPGTHPTIGIPGRQEATEEMRLELIAPRSAVPAICEAVRKVHSYENPVIDVISLEDFPAGCGLGRIGKLDKPVTVQTLVNRIKKAINVRQVLVAQPVNKNPKASRNLMISTAACCAGSCGSLAQDAIKAGAQFYLTGEMRHHDALAATAAGMTVVCVGHSNSERLVLARLAQKLKGLLPKLQVSLSRQDKDPFVIG